MFGDGISTIVATATVIQWHITNSVDKGVRVPLDYINMTDKRNDLPTRIRAHRQEKGLSQAELAERVGVAQTAISQFETGAKTPRLDTLVRLAAGLGISTSVLMPDPEAPNDA